jgi:polysaccharide export outer membrane protein
MADAWGSTNLKNLKLRAIFRLFAYCSRWAVAFLLLGIPAAFAQQKAQQQAPTTTPAVDAVAAMNERIAQLAGATLVKPGDYSIGSGDLLGIDVFDVPELSRDVRVNETGYISLPLMPAKVRASGLTTFQLQDKLAELLQTNGLVSTPQVSVTLKEQHSQPITVIGSVKNAMVIQATRQITLLQALSQAGGISEDAGNFVIVTRPAKDSDPADTNTPSTRVDAQTYTIGLADLLETGDSRFNIPVLGGDVVSVPRAGIIYVVGAVNKPGGFVIQNDRDRMTTLKMLSLAGGTTSTAKATEAIILRKNPDSGKRDEVPVDLNKIMKLKTEDVSLQASDILFVPDSSGKHALHRAGDIAAGLTTGLAIVAASKY